MESIKIKDNKILIQQPTTSASTALMFLHGRGATAESALLLLENIEVPDNCLVIIPQAPNNTWYPNRFIVPTTENEPELSNALEIAAELFSYAAKTYNIQSEQTILAGFSQGACLAAEYVKRNPKRYQGVAVLSGGLIGTDDEVATEVPGSLLGTPIYLGCDTKDFHIPRERVEESAAYFSKHEAETDLRLYEGLGHTVHHDAIDFIQNLLR